MSDEWDFYFARINDAPASIFVDLGIRPHVPVEKRPWLLWVWVALKSPKPDGLASNEEARLLTRIGEQLDSTVASTCGAQLVARVTSAGRREFYFYGVEPGELAAAAANALQGFEGYGFEFGSTFQPEWDQYFSLFPSSSNLERMRNRRLLEDLASQGDIHDLPRKVEHWLYFANEATRDACRDTLVAIDFAVEDEGRLEDEESELPCQLVVSRIDVIDAHTINGITLELARVAREYGGYYDGWNCDATLTASG